MAINISLSTNLPIFDGKIWNKWLIQMRVWFGAQDFLNFVIEDYISVAENTTEEQRNAQRDKRKKDQKALFFVHQCVDQNVFEKIGYSTMSKGPWDILDIFYGGDTSVKKVKLQSLRKQYENLNMKDNEKVSDYISRVFMITNEMKACG